MIFIPSRSSTGVISVAGVAQTRVETAYLLLGLSLLRLQAIQEGPPRVMAKVEPRWFSSNEVSPHQVQDESFYRECCIWNRTRSRYMSGK
ncbi:hypothetical protein BDP81DRAFT_441196 [Colletotrichum phormii]|uniref:Uncharacterized protein n=1 Tax=Colletotrichum phormii TaxID=359342 RepID=A0AAI9ZFH7_9PEZI|nr:uncharacterized protein BDP81DRAFT_441196 [Colletotrichum phormii]KAK1622434.1 hypothetical protein BDP81DRAFT_441196 [Colletotrichum phormii]